jgi:hypothetical protein
MYQHDAKHRQVTKSQQSASFLTSWEIENDKRRSVANTGTPADDVPARWAKGVRFAHSAASL